MPGVKELAVQPSPSVEAAPGSAGASIKSILFVVRDDVGLSSRLEAALSLARGCSAHLQMLQVIPLEAYTVVDTYGGTFASGAIVEALEDDAAKTRRLLEHQLNKEDVSWSYEIARSPTLPALVQAAALADVVFIGRQPDWREFGHTGPSLLGALLCGSRAPLCIPGDGQETFDPFGPAIVAWNGSVEAANAVRSAIGMLRMASTVRILHCVEDRETGFPDTRLLEYLSRHGVAAVLEERSVRTDFATDIVDYARMYSAEYIVMGGYGHTRASEFLFGGVTRALLGACPTALVMAH